MKQGKTGVKKLFTLRTTKWHNIHRNLPEIEIDKTSYFTVKDVIKMLTCIAHIWVNLKYQKARCAILDTGPRKVKQLVYSPTLFCFSVPKVPLLAVVINRPLFCAAIEKINTVQLETLARDCPKGTTSSYALQIQKF